jgi:hypothetical protein
MRIAFSGTSCSGKSTTIKHFLEKWPTYSVVKSGYRDLVKDNKHSKDTTPKLQKEILDILCAESDKFTAHEKVIYDRCPLDNLVYTMWCYGKGISGFTENDMEYALFKVRQSMKNFDVIFLCTRDLMPPIQSNGIREVDAEYVGEIDNIFKAILSKYKKGTDALPFFDKDDAPAIIDIHGEPHERIAQIAMYVTEEGDAYGEDQSLIDINKLSEMQRLIDEQKDEFDKAEKPIIITK